MTQEEYRTAMENVIDLVCCAVHGEKPDLQKVSAMDLSRVYAAARRHYLTAAVGIALQSAGIRDEKIVQATAKAQRKTALLDEDRAALFACLEQAGIWYMPLKGAVLKELYPQYGMREMSDNDILVDADRAGDVKTIMEGLHFTNKSFGRSNHDVYHKPPVSNFEIHTALFGPAHEEKIYRYYRDVKSRLIKDEENRCGWHFTPEDFYLYITAHEYKHYSNSGTGLRSLLDTYVYITQKGQTLDWSYIAGEAEKLGIAEFEKKNRSLSMHLFGSEAMTEADREMLDYILSSGTYGTLEHSVNNQIRKHGRAGFFFRKAFLPYRSMVKLYPVLEKAPFLLPFCWPLRILKALHTKRRKVLYMSKAIFRAVSSEETRP